MPSAVTVDVTTGTGGAWREQFDEVWNAVVAHLDDPATRWITTRTHQDPWPDSGRTQPRWLRLTWLLDRARESVRWQIQLPDTSPGARGRVTLNTTPFEFICLPADCKSGDTYSTALRYPHVDPLWIHHQPRHTRALLDAVSNCLTRVPHQRCKQLTTGELATRAAPLLHLPPPSAETLASALNAYTPDYLDDVLDAAHAIPS